VALSAQRSPEKVRSRACFHAHQGVGQVGGVGQQLRARELLPNNHLAVLIESDEMKNGLAQIDADRSNVHETILHMYAAARSSHAG
jgi:hypothetical protein